MRHMKKIVAIFALLAAAALLSGCDIVVLNPAGFIAKMERNLIVMATVVMLCVVIPVMITVVVFAIKYRAGGRAEYLPDWGHSTKIEIVMWGIPIIIVTILAIPLAYFAFKYDPSNPIDTAIVGEEKPLQVDVVALDWKWLFIYPEYGVASVNELYAPAGRQVFLQLTAEDAINAFWVPTLGTVLYAMPQMNAKLHLYTQELGEFDGASANYSGDGFAGMHFKWHSVEAGEFDAWIGKLRENGATLDRQRYMELAKKSKNNPVEHFAQVDNDLYYRVVNRCVADGTRCNEELMRLAAAQTLWGQICSVFDPDQLAVN